MNTKTYNIFYALLLLGAFLVAASSVSALWQGPTQSPPGGNVAAPINVGNNSQIKEGNLTLNVSNSFLNGLLVPYGNVGIGTINPQGKLEIISGGCYYRFTSTAYDSNCPYIIDPVELNLVIASDTANYNIATVLGNPTTAKSVTLTINSGVKVYSTSTSQTALNTGMLPAGSKVKIVNKGSIIGKGGDGGQGGGVSAGNCCWRQSIFPASTGQPGGLALEIRLPVTIDNSSGNIWGGGGGGGGGAHVLNRPISKTGGGGGGGAGGGIGGIGGSICENKAGSPECRGSGGECSGWGTAGVTGGATGGVGGSKSDTTSLQVMDYQCDEDGNCACRAENRTVYNGYSGAGGMGGDYGQQGGAGGSSDYWGWDGSRADNLSKGTGASGGAAGKAINTNGNSITWTGGNDATRVKGAVN